MPRHDDADALMITLYLLLIHYVISFAAMPCCYALFSLRCIFATPRFRRRNIFALLSSLICRQRHYAIITAADTPLPPDAITPFILSFTLTPLL